VLWSFYILVAGERHVETRATPSKRGQSQARLRLVIPTQVPEPKRHLAVAASAEHEDAEKVLLGPKEMAVSLLVSLPDSERAIGR
jgi:hypothetical protein